MAEICSKSNILGSAYFFAAADSTRNTTSSLVATIAYQLGRENPGLKEYIGSAIEEDELIFSRSLLSQLTALICDPVRLLHGAGKLDLGSFRYAILIDGLDECQGEDNQAEILLAVKEFLLNTDLPFRIFIASRPEWAIRHALRSGGELNELAYHIQLSDQYDATADIRRYLWRRLHDLGLRSSDPRAQSPGWSTQEHIEQLVVAASGQFIYAATVIRYLSERRSSPMDKLKIVLTWTPVNSQSARPFEQLDLLYSRILFAAKTAYEAVDIHSDRDFLLPFRAYQINATRGFTNIDSTFNYGFSNEELNGLLCMDHGTDAILVSDLRSLVTINPHDPHGTTMHLYHKSFSDFLDEESRSKELFVSYPRVRTHLAKCFLQNVIRCPGFGA
ncbi:hypothetical protein EST38_g6631 [Candolleomyces aberdarensis]|uniref:Nephrocystin 3-like N-terminal domain-containing protein n=1 Tax=Candolleomyces aberdarensis TaxID=2316362 RepID=A0A4Q2DK58_9AGAR|nr:hypothetical protein EST38_g6631 [Candolleomyces aberdarensis]